MPNSERKTTLPGVDTLKRHTCHALSAVAFALLVSRGVDASVDFTRDTAIVIATGSGSSHELTAAADGVWFDIDGNGTLEKIAWTPAGSDLAFLAIDLNKDGIINNGRELFGNHTVAGASNGFAALARLNKEANGGVTRGTVSSEDALFARLLLWTDANHNGVSEPSELRAVGEIITDIGLLYQTPNRRDRHGNEFRYRGFVDMRTAPGRNKVTGPEEDKQRHRDIFEIFLKVHR